MFTLIDDCTTSKAAIFDKPLGNDREAAIRDAIGIWNSLTTHDQYKRDAFYITDGDDSIDIMRGPYRYDINYWTGTNGYSHSETWENLDYYLPAETYLDCTFVDRDDAVGRWYDGINVEVYLDGVLVDSFFHKKEGGHENDW